MLFTGKVILERGEEVLDDGDAPGPPEQLLASPAADVGNVGVVEGEAEDPAEQRCGVMLSSWSLPASSCIPLLVCASPPASSPLSSLPLPRAVVPLALCSRRSPKAPTEVPLAGSAGAESLHLLSLRASLIVPEHQSQLILLGHFPQEPRHAACQMEQKHPVLSRSTAMNSAHQSRAQAARLEGDAGRD